MAYYKDLRQYLNELEKKDKLIRVKRRINKDTELHPLTRLQFRGLPEEERKGFLFENVTDSKGKNYRGSVAVCVLAANREIYSLGLGADGPDKIQDKWIEALSNPIDPITVNGGPIHEEVHIGDGLLEHGGFEEFPVPISTPGYDAGPFLSSPWIVSKSPETGIYNIGTYRCHIKSPSHSGVCIAASVQHLHRHMLESTKLKKPLEVAIVIGGPPCLGYVSVVKTPYQVDEYAFASAIAGEPLELVKCKTVDLLVPAHAEIVFEGTISTTEVEPEAPFGETHGYMGGRIFMPYFTISCITHRKNPVFQAFLSQFPPSESTGIKLPGNESTTLAYLKHTCKQPWIMDVAYHESTSALGHIVIKVANTEQANVWKTLEEAAEFAQCNSLTRIIIAVDEDINARDPDAVNWAMTTRMLPHRDCRTKTSQEISLLDQALTVQEERIERDYRLDAKESSVLLINATMKWPYTPISLPKKEFMERALQIWNEEGLPELKLKEPWWGINLGYWLREWNEDAALAAQGDYKIVGDKLVKQRRKLSEQPMESGEI